MVPISSWTFDSIWREGGLLVCVVVVIFENPVAVALLMNIAVYIIDNLQVIEVTKMELKQILKDGGDAQIYAL